MAKILFEKDKKLAIDYWKNTELESEDRRTNVLHQLVDLPFKVQKNVANWSGFNGPSEEQIDVMPMLKKIFDLVDEEVVIGREEIILLPKKVKGSKKH